ncbi:MAG: hypothetical protein GY790_19720 [Bacteroidetes bacterium]|nr:hypothetical protein [Bacteroidota bacterium]
MAKLKESIGKKILKRKKRGADREVRVHNFETARTAIILFDTGDPESFNAIREFRKFLEGEKINCRTFGYVQQKEIPQELLLRKNYSFITKNDLNWYMKPSGEVVDAFYYSDPDLLFDFTLDVPLELQFLVQLSSARFKVGCFTKEENDYDLMISLTDNHEIGFLAEQFKIYIAMLNPVNEQI